MCVCVCVSVLQTEPPSQQHVNIQKELWRIQDVMEALSKHRPQRPGPDGCYGSVPMTEVRRPPPRT